MDDERLKTGLIAEERKISPAVVAATAIIIVMFALGLLYQLLMFIGFV